MGTTIEQGPDRPREMAPAGNHRAICCRVIDLGTQSYEFNGEAIRAHKVLLGFELSDEPAADGSPLQISQEFTASLHEKSKLRPFLESWRGRAFTPQELARFDLANLLGQPCLISVIHEVSKKGKSFAAISGVGRMPKGMAAPEPVADFVHYQLEDGDPPADALPAWIIQKIDRAEERSGLAPVARPDLADAGVVADAIDPDCPF